MSMSKKDFIALADALKAVKPGPRECFTSASNHEQALHTWGQCVDRVADVCQYGNPNFMKGRWLGYIAGTNGPSGGSTKPPSKTDLKEDWQDTGVLK